MNTPDAEGATSAGDSLLPSPKTSKPSIRTLAVSAAKLNPYLEVFAAPSILAPQRLRATNVTNCVEVPPVLIWTIVPSPGTASL
jgi:hypothetical protein